MWVGETAKKSSAFFGLARDRNSVLLFDEADAIAARRSISLDQASQRESNAVVNVLLQELETFNGVVIFATNMAANFDRRSRDGFVPCTVRDAGCHERSASGVCRFTNVDAAG